jgi:hypothetical protein
MHEIVPVLCGLALGAGLGVLRPSIRLPVGAVLSIVIGVLATVITGEFKSTWAYLLIDIPLVACTAFLGLAAARQLRQIRHQSDLNGRR